MVVSVGRKVLGIAEMSLRTLLRLPSLQHGAVILKDVLRHTIEEISSATGVSEPAAKSALQRGRVGLRELAAEPENISTPVLSRFAGTHHGFTLSG